MHFVSIMNVENNLRSYISRINWWEILILHLNCTVITHRKKWDNMSCKSRSWEALHCSWAKAKGIKITLLFQFIRQLCSSLAYLRQLVVQLLELHYLIQLIVPFILLLAHVRRFIFSHQVCQQSEWESHNGNAPLQWTVERWLSSRFAERWRRSLANLCSKKL